MTITRDNGGLAITCDNDKTSTIHFYPGIEAEKARVIKCPKYLRKGGKQYKVTELRIKSSTDYNKEVHVPKDVPVYGADDLKVVYYE